MSTFPRSVVERERAALADGMADLGPDAPTCCAGWTTAHLAAHLVVRGSRVDALLGFTLESAGRRGPAVAWAHRAENRLRASASYAELVARVRTGPPVWVPMAWPGIGPLLDVNEFVIHHEDVRRAQPGWQPRSLSRADQDLIWSTSAAYARRAGRRGVLLRRTDVEGTVEGTERRVGAAGRTVEGEPLELLLWLARRRDVARVRVS